MGSGVSSVKPGMLRKCRTHGIPACAGIIRLRRRGPPNAGSLDPEDPLHQGLHVLVLDAGVGGHRHLAPVADSALLHLLDQHRFGLGIALVLLCDFPVGRPDQLLVDRVAGGAGVLLRELLAGEGGGGDCDGREQQGEALHLGGPVGRGDYRAGGILGNPSVSRNFSGESTGCRQVTPSHTQALTVSDAGFASTGGNPTVPAGMNSESVLGAKASSSMRRQGANASRAPMTIMVRGGTSCSSSAARSVPKPAGWRSNCGQKSATVPAAASA